MANESLNRHYGQKYATDKPAEEIPFSRWPSDRFEAARRFIPQHFRGGAVLELAAGNGRVARSLLDAMPSITAYTALELSAPRVAAMRESVVDPRFCAESGDAENLPGSLGRFDLIILVALIEHLIDPIRAMRRIQGHLNPGGMVYVDTPNIAKWTRRLKLLVGRFPSTASTDEGLKTYEGTASDLYDEGHLHYFTYRSLTLMLKEHCGFGAVTRVGYATGGLRRVLGRRLEFALSAAWPTLLSDIALIARI